MTRLMCILILLLGVLAHSTLLAEPPPSRVVKAVPGVEPVEPVPLPVGATIDIDVAELAARFHELPVEERAEQLADWAVYGTLLHSGLGSSMLVDATFDRTPLRLPSLEDVYHFDYGPGRQLVVGNDVWLFYSEYDENPKVTLGRLADSVRMSQGEIPTSVHVFRFRSNLADGSIIVTRENDVTGAELFSADHGYHEAHVSSAQELEDWLATVDDVTHVRPVEEGSLVVGGRRFENDRREGIELEDVAALYQAHVELAKNRKVLDDASARYIAPFNRIIDDYDRLAQWPSSRSPLAIQHLWWSVDSLRRVLIDADNPSLPELRPLVRPGAIVDEMKRIADQIELLQPKVEAAAAAASQRVAAQLARDGIDFAPEPGFSLDPQWNTAGLVADLRALRSSPHKLVEEARQVMEAWKEREVDETAKPGILWAAEEVVDSVDEDSDLELQPAWAAKIDEAIGGLAGSDALEADVAVLVPFYELEDLLRRVVADDETTQWFFRSTTARAAVRTMALIEFIEARNQIQCARYDGPLDGTRVGMSLFYTDVLAKLWASVDWRREAPVAAVLGFKAHPIEGQRVEAAYAEEEARLPYTRIWFGPRDDAFSSAESGELDFAPIATRIYSAGSNPLHPGEESTPAEASRRVMGWWNRHFAQVADHEPQYHVQNQIMKWSMITGWMVEREIFEDLARITVRRDHRFERWYAENDQLRFRKDIRLLPPGTFSSATECMERLHSYPFEELGGMHFISGGVSLGGRQGFLSGATRLRATTPRALRRPGMNYAASKPRTTQLLNGARFERPASVGRIAESVATPARNARFRARGTDMDIGQLHTRLSQQRNAGVLELESDIGVVGRLEFETSHTGVRLRWSDGSLARDASRLADMSKTRSASQLATKDGFLPRDGVYLMESDAGVSAIVSREGRAPRMLQEGASSSSKIRSATTINEPSFEAIPLEAADVHARLSTFSWQRLTPASPGLDRVSGQVGRVFSNKAPIGGRAIRIETGDSAIPVVDGVIEGRTLHLRRPAGATRVFDDFVSSHAIDGAVLRGLETRARGLGTPAEVLQIRLGRDPGATLTARLDVGDYAGAVRELQRAAHEGSLERALTGFRERVTELRLDGLRTGRRTELGRFLTREKGLSGDELLGRTLDGSTHRPLGSMVDDLSALLRSGKISKPALHAATDSAHVSPGLRGYLDAAAKGDAGALGKIGIEVSGNKVHAVGKLSPHAQSRVLEAAERQDFVRRARELGNVEVYVEDSASLRLRDWDAVPSQTLSRIQQEGRTNWIELSRNELGPVLPDRIATPRGTFVRQAMEATPAPVSGLPPVVLMITDCDGDGQPDAMGLAGCQ